MADVTQNETSLVFFSCNAIGEPAPSISWHFNDVMIIASGNKYRLSYGGVPGRAESSLTISNLTSSDAGTYTCHAENVVGSVNISGILTVNGNNT